ncbi:zinc finger domain-containing protein [Streptomyces natalensis]|uniref:DNA-binding phage zinc finger domain-containing protein n=1 Tax=Streptomyces natalensis ATCC 27448 TaxID=1240678 RepID=A0A0D7CHN2_9ACTN|nr:hypothetical protein [Streptomyces natalensis]KIZ15754.1 hypothetical protein SNA_24740 [Streptomyces natalensis ATCC 27448]
MRLDKRRIQTAVLSNADSDQPLVLPLEPIELDAFRQHHQHDTFWCGHLLGGCGGQLTTKLYTDRVCHFAHHPDPTGLPRICERRARDVSSADHLYLKAAATQWLTGRGHQAAFTFPQPDGAAIGSVLDIAWDKGDGALRVHLDATVPPAWESHDVDVVLGMSVPVDDDTLVRRWYVHRVRFDSAGTAREVRIGTQAFARDTEWFTLDECDMTDRGLSTPAVKRIVRSRSTRPVAPWPTGRTRRVPDAQARAKGLLRRLADAQKFGSVVVVTRVCREIAAVTGGDEETRRQLTAAVSEAERWLEAQAAVRQELFGQLEKAVASGKAKQVRKLLTRANATAGHDRSDAENAIVDAAVEQLAAHRREQAAAQAAARAASGAWRAAGRVHTLLTTLQRRGIGQRREAMRDLVQELVRVAEQADDCVDPRQQKQIDTWKVRAGLDRPPPQAKPQPAAPHLSASVPKRKTKKRPLHEQVGRRSWTKTSCPRCLAPKGRDCLNDDGVGKGEERQFPHDERLQLIISERSSRAERRKPGPRSRPASSSPVPRSRPEPPSPLWRVKDVSCPECGVRSGSRCETPDGRPHQARVTWFKRRFPSR